MVKKVDVHVKGQVLEGVEMDLPGAPLVIATAPQGFVMCGYLNIDTANKLSVPAAMVRGVKTVPDLLAASVVAVSEKALSKGVTLGMTGQDALAQFL